MVLILVLRCILTFSLHKKLMFWMCPLDGDTATCSVLCDHWPISPFALRADYFYLAFIASPTVMGTIREVLVPWLGSYKVTMNRHIRSKTGVRMLGLNFN